MLLKRSMAVTIVTLWRDSPLDILSQQVSGWKEVHTSGLRKEQLAPGADTSC